MTKWSFGMQCDFFMLRSDQMVYEMTACGVALPIAKPFTTYGALANTCRIMKSAIPVEIFYKLKTGWLTCKRVEAIYFPLIHHHLGNLNQAQFATHWHQ